VSPDREQAAADLAALDRDRAALAERVATPWWFGPGMGAALFLVIASNAVEPEWVSVPAVLLGALGIGALAGVYQRRSGVWRTIPPRLMAGWLVFAAVVLVPAFVLGDERPWVFVVAGAVLGVAIAVLSRRWTRAWQRELREGV
jgi:hypothetical protein